MSDRITGIIDKVSNAEKLRTVDFVLKAPVVKNLAQSVVDSKMKANLEFQGGTGLPARVERISNGYCCEWCNALVGVYEYPNVPGDVWMRHDNCNCLIEYTPADKRERHYLRGAKTNQEDYWVRISEEEFNARKNFVGVQTNTGTPIQTTHGAYKPESINGVKPGNPMSFKEADNYHVNPDYNTDYAFHVNCQTCVPVMEARRRGYDVKAVGNYKNGGAPERLSRDTRIVWRDPQTGMHPDYVNEFMDPNLATPKKYLKFMEDTIKPGERYSLEFAWKGRSRSGHIVNVDRTPDGKLRIYDNQRGKGEVNEWTGAAEVLDYLKGVKYKTTVQGQSYPTVPKMLRIDNMDFNLDIIDELMVPV